MTVAQKNQRTNLKTGIKAARSSRKELSTREIRAFYTWMRRIEQKVDEILGQLSKKEVPHG